MDGAFTGIDDVTRSRLNEWNLGVVQEIDAAAMSMWVQYDNFQAHVSGCANDLQDNGVCDAAGVGHTSLDTMQVVKFGGLINF